MVFNCPVIVKYIQYRIDKINKKKKNKFLKPYQLLISSSKAVGGSGILIINMEF